MRRLRRWLGGVTGWRARRLRRLRSARRDAALARLEAELRRAYVEAPTYGDARRTLELMMQLTLRR
jgi:hypothetical protein